MRAPRQEGSLTVKASLLVLPGLLVWQTFLLVWICGSFAAVWPLPACMALALLLAASKNIRTLPRLLLAFCVFISAFLLVSTCLDNLENSAAPLPPWAEGAGPFKGEFCGAIERVQGLPNRRVRLYLSGLRPKNGAAEDSLPALCSLTREDDDPFFSPLPGQTACFTGSVRKTRPNINTESALANPAWKIRQSAWQAYSNKRSSFEISGQGYPLYAIREKARANFLRALGFESGKPLSEKEWQSPSVQARAILAALCFGDRRLLSYSTTDNFAAAAIAHSLALSGQHLGTAALLAVWGVFLITRWRPRLYLRFPRVCLSAFLAVPLAALYLWIGDAPPSLIRAGGMLFLLALFIWSQKTYSGLDLIFGAILLFILFKPLIVFDLGLQLSALCVLIIILFAPAVSRLGDRLPELKNPFFNKLLRRSLEIILISLLIQVFLLPINLLYFSMAGFYFPVNLLWLPALGVFVLPLAFLALLISLIPGGAALASASFIAGAAALPCEWLSLLLEKARAGNFFAESAFARPHWIYFIIFAILAGSLAWLWSSKNNPKARKSCAVFLTLALLLALAPPAMRLCDNLRGGISAEILDVGQGLSVYIKAEGVRLVYDGGGSALSHFDVGKNIVAPVLAANSAPRIDAIINSHPDMDHLGGLLYLLESFDVRKIFHNGHEAGGAAGKKWRDLKNRPEARALYAGDIIFIGKNGLQLEVLHPPAPESGAKGPNPDWSGNSASLALRLSKDGEGLLLLTGDAEKDALKYILESERDISAKALIAPHHGSDRSLVEEFYRQVNPELAAAACGFQNRWRYPGKKLRAFLKKMNINFVDTGNSGLIRITFKDSGMRAETMNNMNNLNKAEAPDKRGRKE